MVTADHYVILTDGTNGNPDIGMLKMLTDARGSDRYTISLTNREFRLVAFFAEDRVQHTRRYGVRFRSPTALSIAVDLEAGS